MSFHKLIFLTLCIKSLNDLGNSYFNLAAGVYFYIIKVRARETIGFTKP